MSELGAATWSREPPKVGRWGGAILSFLVHAVAVGLFLWWGRPEPHLVKPAPPVQTIFVSMESLVRKGTATTKELPRLDNAPALTPTEAIHLGKVDLEPTADEKKEQERQAREEAKEREKQMKKALREATLSGNGRADDPRHFKDLLDMLPGQEGGSELGTAATGRLQAAYSDQVSAALRENWSYSFIPEEELARLCGKVVLEIDRERFLRRYSWDRRSGNGAFDATIDTALKRFLKEGDQRLPPFPDEKSFGQSVTYKYTFRKDLQVRCPW